MSDMILKYFGADGLKSFEAPESIIMQRTELGRYATCPQQASLCREHEKEIETHDVLPTIGSFIHDIAKEAIEFCDEDLQEAADYFAEELPKIRPDIQPEALRAGRNLANEFRHVRTNRVLLYEQPVSRTLMPTAGDRGEVIVTVEPDLVLATYKEDMLIVPDYKTGWKDRSNAEAKDDFQTCVNCWVLFGKYPAINTIRFVYLNTRLFTRSYAWVERERDEANFESRIFEVARLWLDEADEAWPEEKKCSMCPVIKWCKWAEAICKELDGNPKAYVDNTIVLSELLKTRERVIGNATQNGRRLYGTEGYFDDSPKKKSPRRVSFKPVRKDKDNGNGKAD